MNVFLDTNVIASATATRGLCSDVLRSVVEFHEWVVSEHLIEEVRRVLKDKFNVSPEIIADLVWLLRQDTRMAESLPLANLPLKDPADVTMVSAAIHGNAEILVTGDKEILALKHVGPLKILTPRQFWEIEKNGG